MTPFNHLLVSRLQDVLFITLNNPATRNALSTELVDELTQVTTHIQADTQLRAVVLRGSQGFFCAGGNIGNFEVRLNAQRQASAAPNATLADDPVAARNRVFGHFLESWSALPVPMIAVVEGAAMGGGMGLACTADIVLTTRDAKFALTETALGIIPAQIAPFVEARIGRRNTLRLGLFGEWISGEQAVALSIVDELAADSAALDALLAQWLTRMCRCAPHANQALKRLLTRESSTPALSQQLDQAALVFSRCMQDEGEEGIAAFRSKRAANWHATFSAEQIRQAYTQAAA